MTRRSRAFTVIVSAPNHLIGSNAQIAAAQAAHDPSALPPWYAEWSDFLPAWHIAILESPYDVGQFFRGAERDPATPRVGMIANAKLSLGSGFALGAEDRSGPHHAHRDAWLDQRYQIGTHEQTTSAAIRKAKRTAAKAAQEALDANGDAAAEEPTQPGVSPRTQARDRALRTTTPLPRRGICCPRCRRRVLTRKGDIATADAVRRRGIGQGNTCEHCGEHLTQMTRERDNVQDRNIPLFNTPEWETYHYDAAGNRTIPWGERPMSNPRYPLGVLIGKRYKGRVDLYLCDEIHECKGKATAIGRAFGAVVRAAKRTVGLTGTLFGGKASDVYSLLLRLGNKPVLDRFGWHNEAAFVEAVGVQDTITSEHTPMDDAGHFSGKSTVTTRVEERPGITAGLAEIIQNQAIQVLLKHMGFQLPSYTEELVTLDMLCDLATDYAAYEAAGKEIISFGGHDALASYLQGTLLYPYAPWRPKTIESHRKQTGNAGPYTPPRHPADRVLPHHAWLAQYAAQEVQQGRRVLIYCEHTGFADLMTDISRQITHIAHDQHGVTLNVAMLHATTVAPGERNAWFQARASEGVNVVICNPRLVKTGLNLIDWPSIVVLEPVYSLFTLAQAKRRAFRPTQTQPCTVSYVCYRDTMSERAIGIVARKSAAAAILSGDDLAGGLLEFDAGMDLLQELANSVLNGASAINTDIQALLTQGAQALKADLEEGTAGMLGAHPTTPEQVALPTVPARPSAARSPTIGANAAVVFGNLNDIAATLRTKRVTRRVADRESQDQATQAALWDLGGTAHGEVPQTARWGD